MKTILTFFLLTCPLSAIAGIQVFSTVDATAQVASLNDSIGSRKYEAVTCATSDAQVPVPSFLPPVVRFRSEEGKDGPFKAMFVGVIDKSGKILEAHCLTTNHEAYAQHVAKQLKRWRFQGGKVNGAAQAFVAVFPFEQKSADDWTPPPLPEDIPPIPGRVPIRPPWYPVEERRAGICGEVLFEVSIDDNERIDSWKILRSTTPNFEKQCNDAMRKTKKMPGVPAGRYCYSVVFTGPNFHGDFSRPATFWVSSDSFGKDE